MMLILICVPLEFGDTFKVAVINDGNFPSS